MTILSQVGRRASFRHKPAVGDAGLWTFDPYAHARVKTVNQVHFVITMVVNARLIINIINTTGVVIMFSALMIMSANLMMKIGFVIQKHMNVFVVKAMRKWMAICVG